VRLVVTKIYEFREESLVLRGANAGSNGQIGPDDENDEELMALRARLAEETGTSRRSFSIPKQVPAPRAADPENKETDMKIKLTAEQKKALGLEAQTGDEFEESIVLAAIDALNIRLVKAETTATSVQAFIDSERAEVVRLATMVEGLTGADQKVILPPIFADAIANASAAKLQEWKADYQKKVDAKFAPKCAKCGSTEVSRRSSVDDTSSTQGAPAKRVPKSGL
jgi:hypothetical protein